MRSAKNNLRFLNVSRATEIGESANRPERRSPEEVEISGFLSVLNERPGFKVKMD